MKIAVGFAAVSLLKLRQRKLEVLSHSFSIGESEVNIAIAPPGNAAFSRLLAFELHSIFPPNRSRHLTMEREQTGDVKDAVRNNLKTKRTGLFEGSGNS